VKTVGAELCSLMKLCVVKYCYAICMHIGLLTVNKVSKSGCGV